MEKIKFSIGIVFKIKGCLNGFLVIKEVLCRCENIMWGLEGNIIGWIKYFIEKR